MKNRLLLYARMVANVMIGGACIYAVGYFLAPGALSYPYSIGPAIVLIGLTLPPGDADRDIGGMVSQRFSSVVLTLILTCHWAIIMMAF